MWWTNQLPFLFYRSWIKDIVRRPQNLKKSPTCFHTYSITFKILWPFRKLELYEQNLEIFKMFARDKMSSNRTFVYHFFKVEKKLKDPVWAPISQPKICIPSTIRNKLRDHPLKTSANFHDFMSLLLKLTFYTNFKIL